MNSQVNGAKVVASSKSESKRFGIVTMSTADQAQACIENVNNTEFLDNLITVELVRKVEILLISFRQQSNTFVYIVCNNIIQRNIMRF